ncbi:unnamed protein product [Chrysoparadoxa australica]
MTGILKKSPVPFTKRAPQLPVEVLLGSNSLKFTEEGWQLTGGELTRFEYQNERLKGELSGAKKSLEEVEGKLKEQGEEINMVKFQNQLLQEMLAVARVEERHFKDELDRERARQKELTKELEKAYNKMLAEA